MKRASQILIVIFVTAIMLTPAIADAADKDPYLKPDETWIKISGTAVETKPESFLLDYGEGLITVEMNGWEWYEDYNIIEGDRVTVYGEIDDDLFETTTIEASSVYDQNLARYFYASAADEKYDEDYDYWVDAEPIIPGETTVRGIVTSIDGREFTIDTGARQVRVDTILMPYNPMDDAGYVEVDKGDYVSATGDMEGIFWENRELEADTLVVLHND